MFAAGPAWADMSGTYVGRGPELVAMLQIVETSGGNLTGRYEVASLRESGKLEHTGANITGVRSGKFFVLWFGTAGPLDCGFLGTSGWTFGKYEAGALRLAVRNNPELH